MSRISVASVVALAIGVLAVSTAVYTIMEFSLLELPVKEWLALGIGHSAPAILGTSGGAPRGRLALVFGSVERQVDVGERTAGRPALRETAEGKRNPRP